jgi:DNA-binding CsgD family transcriptional regulator
LLAEGKSFAEACVEMAITDNTGRTHLKRIFSKTDTNRQSALVKLILNGPANIRRNAE